MSSELKTQFLNYMTVQRFSDHTKRSYTLDGHNLRF